MEFYIILLALCIIISGFFLYSYNYQSTSMLLTKDLYAEGLDLLIAGKRKAAYKNFKNIIDNDSGNIKAYLRLGQVLREGGNSKQALKIHKGLIHRKKLNNYDKIELHKNLALDYYQSEKYDLAEKDFRGSKFSNSKERNER